MNNKELNFEDINLEEDLGVKEEDTYLNSVVLYDSREDFNNINPYKEYFEYAKIFGI